MLKEVVEFNRLRNGFAYDANVEVKMFNEEVREFFDAETIAGRVDGLIDTMFVKLGTMSKLAYNGLDAEELPYPHKTVIDMMTNIVQTELGQNYLRVIKEAERIVCEVNATKGTVLSEGKVAKAANIRNATVEIHNMISNILKEQEAKEA